MRKPIARSKKADKALSQARDRRARFASKKSGAGPSDWVHRFIQPSEQPTDEEILGPFRQKCGKKQMDVVDIETRVKAIIASERKSGSCSFAHLQNMVNESWVEPRTRDYLLSVWNKLEEDDKYLQNIG
jgi:hypothetical protein